MHFIYSHRTRSVDGQYVHIKELTDALCHEGHRLTICSPDGIEAVAGYSADKQEADSNNVDRAITRGAIAREGTIRQGFVEGEEAAIGNSQDRGRPVGIRARRLDADAGENTGWINHLPRFVYEFAEIGYSVPALYRLLKAMYRQRADRPRVIYERYNLFFFAGLWLKKITKRPLMLEVNSPLFEERAAHGGIVLKAFARWGERAVWRGADAVLPVTKVLAGHIEAAGVSAEKIHVIPNGVGAPFLAIRDGDMIRRRFGLEDRIVLGFVGFVRDWHGVDLALEFVAQNRHMPLHLLIVGDGPHLSALMAQAGRLDIEARVTFAGVVQRAEIPDFIAGFDIALQPRVTPYASPLKLIEYMALGRAILAPSFDNIREVVRDGETASLFDGDDRDSFFEKLGGLCLDQGLRRRLGAAARAKIINDGFTWRDNARKVHMIAQSLTTDKGLSNARNSA